MILRCLISICIVGSAAGRAAPTLLCSQARVELGHYHIRRRQYIYRSNLSLYICIVGSKTGRAAATLRRAFTNDVIILQNRHR